MSKLNDILALLPDNVTKKIKPVDLRTSVEYIYEDMMSQLGDHILTLGTVTATANKAYLALHTSGKNEVQINNVAYLRTVPQQFAFTPVTAHNKILIIEAQPDADVFHLVEGVEAQEFVEPKYTGLFVARLIVSTTGVMVIPISEGFIPLRGTEVGKPVTGDIEIFTASGETRGLKSKVGGTPYYAYVGFDDDGSPLIVYTSFTGYDTRLNLYNYSLLLGSDNPNFRGIEGIEYYGNIVGDNYFVQQRFVKEYVAEFGGGRKASEVEDDSTLNKGNMKATVEFIDGKINTEKNRNDAQDLAIGNKLDKPTTDGTWVVTRTAGVTGYSDASTLGKNIFNANLVLTTDRTQNLGGYKLSFTNGRFSVPALEMEVTTANSVPNKIWNDGEIVKYTNNLGITVDISTETVAIVLSYLNQDLAENVARKGFVATFPFKILTFNTTVNVKPTGRSITTQLRKNGTAITTVHSVIPANTNNSSTSPVPTFSITSFAIGDVLDFFTPLNGVGSTIKGQNLTAILTILKT